MSPQIRMPPFFMHNNYGGRPVTFVYWDQFTFIDLFLQLPLNLLFKSKWYWLGCENMEPQNHQ